MGNNTTPNTTRLNADRFLHIGERAEHPNGVHEVTFRVTQSVLHTETRERRDISWEATVRVSAYTVEVEDEAAVTSYDREDVWQVSTAIRLCIRDLLNNHDGQYVQDLRHGKRGPSRAREIAWHIRPSLTGGPEIANIAADLYRALVNPDFLSHPNVDLRADR